jgi:Calcium-binding EGF domain/Human growth factor-like EGF
LIASHLYIVRFLGYQCQCIPGFSFNGTYGTGCVDTNECTTGNPCGTNAICTNIVGSYTCKCESGYTGNPPSVPCTDFDECNAVPNRCGPNGVCINQVGSFQCSCNTGYVWPNVNSTCIDDNECSRPNRCLVGTEVCRNTRKFLYVYKSFRFHISFTFIWMVLTLPCLSYPNHDALLLAGNYTCECAPGFIGTSPTCTDINECEQVPSRCGPNRYVRMKCN